MGGTIPKYPKTKKLITNPPKANLLYIPLYRMDFTGLLSSQGTIAIINIAAPKIIKPRNLAVKGHIGKVIALNIA